MAFKDAGGTRGDDSPNSNHAQQSQCGVAGEGKRCKGKEPENEGTGAHAYQDTEALQEKRLVVKFPRHGMVSK